MEEPPTLNGTVGGHRVEVKWDASKRSFSFQIQLSSDHSGSLTCELHPAKNHATDKQAMADEGQHPLKTGKRKEREKEHQSHQKTVKRVRVESSDTITPEEDSGATRATINDVLPPEVISVILQVASQQAPKVMWVVGRMVCRLWKDLLPSGETFKQHQGGFHNKGLGSQICQNGWVSLFHWAASMFPQLNSLKTGAARFGHLDLLKKLCSNDVGTDYLSWLATEAVKGRQLEVLRWLRENGLSFHPGTFDAAVEKGYLEIVKWLTEQRRLRFYEGDIACHMAAFKGHLEILK